MLELIAAELFVAVVLLVVLLRRLSLFSKLAGDVCSSAGIAAWEERQFRWAIKMNSQDARREEAALLQEARYRRKWREIFDAIPDAAERERSEAKHNADRAANRLKFRQFREEMGALRHPRIRELFGEEPIW